MPEIASPNSNTTRDGTAGDADYLCHGLHREPSFGGDLFSLGVRIGDPFGIVENCTKCIDGRTRW